MAKLVGTYTQEKSENLDKYFAAIGVPLIGRKFMALSSPKLTIEQIGLDWTVTMTTMMRTAVTKFKLGVEYVETMPKDFKSTSSMDGDKLVIVSIGPTGTKLVRIYEPTANGCILTLKHEQSGTEAKRFYVRA